MTRRVATVDDFPRIDIRHMRRLGMLQSGTSGTLSWSFGANHFGMVDFECHADRLILYRQGRRSQADAQIVQFDTTPCNYGGKRRWFLCPSCSRRVAVLCGVGGSFLCRHCHHLPYLSQSQSRLRRLIRRRQGIEKRIFERSDGRHRRKRKGLHRQTFARGLERYCEIDRQINGMCSLRIDRLRAAMQAR